MGRGIEQIVNERVLKWQAERKSTVPPPSGVRHAQVSQRPMITISRQCGSFGGELGSLVAQRLGFTFYSQELVHEIATAAKVKADAVASLDEHPRSSLEVVVREILDGEAFAARDYRSYLRRVLRDLGRNGRGVVLGRGGHLLLDPAVTLRVRTYGRLEQRAAHIARREHLSSNEAMSFVRRVDRERAQFYRQHFDVDWGDPSLFDLTINTSSASLEQCAEIVAAAYRARFAFVE